MVMPRSRSGSSGAEYLRFPFSRAQRTRHLEQAVGQRRLTVIDMTMIEKFRTCCESIYRVCRGDVALRV